MPELIDREVTQLLLDTAIKQFSENWLQDKLTKNGLLIAKRIVSKQPTIEPEVRHGAWIAVSMFDACGGDEEVWMAHGNPIAYHYCSECKEEAYVNEEGKEILSDYCPFCGAKLRGVLEDEGTD